MKTAVIIPTHNRPEYLKKCFDSLQKTFLPKETLLFIIDDGSDNETRKIIKDFKKENCIIEKIFKEYNKGVYDSLLIAYDYCFSNGYEYAILIGSDCIVNNYFYDIMNYYKKLFPNNVISGFNTLTLSELGKPRHPIIYNGGFYVVKNTSCSGCNGINENTYNKYIKPTLLQRQKENKLCYDTISSRKASVDGNLIICTVPSVMEHIGVESSLGHDDNPDISIDYRDYIELTNKQTKKEITFNLATYPKREKQFKEVINNLLSINIIDKIRVYLNEYKEVPEFLYDNKIEHIIGKENLKDSGKFYWANTYKDEYYFTIDDDLLIDENYIKKHIELLNKYDNKIFVSLHGKILNEIPANFRDLNKYFHCLEQVINNEWVNFVGTGVMVFDNSKYKIPNCLFKYHGMADLWIALFCQINYIPCLVRKHENNEIKLIYNENETLWNQQASFIKQHEEILRSVKKWKLNNNI
ncbi:MAG: glycosyltransferase family A protein [Sulfurimonas sp.]|jgi:glycosyltransferase involved in cell wall biosynthesis